MALTKITAGGIGALAVDTAELAASAVETAKINNSAVTLAKTTGVQSGWIRLSTVTGDASTYIAIEADFDNTDYRIFRVVGTRMRGAPGNLFAELKIGGSWITSGYSSFSMRMNSNSADYAAYNSTSTSSMLITDVLGTEDDESGFMFFEMAEPWSTTNTTVCHFWCSNNQESESGAFHGGVGGGVIHGNTAAVTGVRFKGNTDALEGTFHTYGLII